MLLERWVGLRRGRGGEADGRRHGSRLVQTLHLPAGLVVFGHGGSDSHLTQRQEAEEAELVEWVRGKTPRRARMIGAWIKETHGVEYSPAGLIALLHRLGLEYRKPEAAPRALDVAKQKAFIELYDKLLGGLDNDEAVGFADAVHPAHQARAVGCWAKKGDNTAIEQSSGRQRLNIHGAADIETGKTQMLDVAAADALSAAALLVAIMAAYPAMRVIHVFLRQCPPSSPPGSWPIGAKIKLVRRNQS